MGHVHERLVLGTLRALIVLVIFFLVGLLVGRSLQRGLTLSVDTLSAWVTALATVCIAILTTFLAKEILLLFPEHTCYVEVFAGGAALFYKKDPAKVEVLN